MGVDPGLRKTGWGVIESKESALRFVACGVIGSDPAAPLAERLRQLHEGLIAVIDREAPIEAAFEETVVNKNAGSSLKLGQARGAALLAAAMRGLHVAEYAARSVKKSVVGSGAAEKSQVAAMVAILLPSARTERGDPPSGDRADALAIAICHAHHRATTRLIAAGRVA